MTSRKTQRLADVLLEEGCLSEDKLEHAFAEQERLGKSLGRVLIDLNYVSESDLVAALAKQTGLSFVELGEFQIDANAASLVSEALARRYLALPIATDDGRLVVAMSDPTNVVALDDIRTVTGMDLKVVVATRSDVLEAIERFKRMDTSAGDIAAAKATDESEDLDSIVKLREVVEEAPIVRLVNLLISQAVTERASDIHIEPQEHDLRVRYRIDGVLHEVMRPSKRIQAGMISRLKIMADINIAERRIPQDGRISLVVGGKGIDLRVATLPTAFGEKVVLRILDKSSVLLKLQDLGFSMEAFARYEVSFKKPYGMILVTGPTGSGKSTTLYATLNILNSPDRNIISVEDPIEYRLPGINQVQTNTKAGLTFASALRSILRSDPDVVLIGEIRDQETAMIAIEASLTGHLVLSTLHTNDAPSAITRLIEMGIEPFLVTSALDCVLAQRLARRLCEKCKEVYEPTPDSLIEARFPWKQDEPVPTLYRAGGCAYCGRTGYRGRMGLHEIMRMSEGIERLTVERRSADEIARMAREQGMTTLREDGLGKVARGSTSLEEILRVVI
ncbi:MAG: ATPase, T2SS/T4P/T4SS family [Actinomycetota bacterium]